uniref:Protein suppressor of white apricot n=1 Tax=Ceratitis capitata TaxID=7213 RepID=W8B603_CERCA
MSYFNLTRPPVREYAGGSVGGILRKGGSSSSSGISSNNGTYNSHASNPSTTGLNAGEARQVDLLVFGYACKLFRDDDKARDIDQGKHMIPWMGDTTLKIDRLIIVAIYNKILYNSCNYLILFLFTMNCKIYVYQFVVN